MGIKAKSQEGPKINLSGREFAWHVQSPRFNSQHEHTHQVQKLTLGTVFLSHKDAFDLI